MQLTTAFFAAAVAILHTVSGLQPFSEWGHERIQLEDTAIFFRYSASGKPPLLLVHGFPEHSPTWSEIGPILAEHYTVIAPDNRGCGDSSLSTSNNYTAPAGGRDLLAVLNFLNISKTYVFAHDKGVGLASSLVLENPGRIARLVVAEYPLPGFGYPLSISSSSLYMNWQLTFFAVPDAAQFFIQGREKEMLAWYFYHASYSGNAAISNDLLETYTRAISKPGFLRAGMEYFAAAFEDEKYFTRKLNESKVRIPVLAMGGEASFGKDSLLRSAFEAFAEDLTTYVIPKAGHWIGHENPTASANRVLQFLVNDTSVPSIDTSWLDDGRTTLFGALGGTEVTLGTNTTA